MPHGRSPAGTRAFTVRLATSMIETSFDGPLAVNTVLPSGDTATPHGRSPTSTCRDLLIGLRVDDHARACPRPVVAKRRVPSGDTAVPIGRTSLSPGSLIVCSRRCFFASITEIDDPFSAGT